MSTIKVLSDIDLDSSYLEVNSIRLMNSGYTLTFVPANSFHRLNPSTLGFVMLNEASDTNIGSIDGKLASFNASVGQTLIISNISTTRIITLLDRAVGGNIYLTPDDSSATNLVLGPNESVALIFSFRNNKWVPIISTVRPPITYATFDTTGVINIPRGTRVVCMGAVGGGGGGGAGRRGATNSACAGGAGGGGGAYSTMTYPISAFTGATQLSIAIGAGGVATFAIAVDNTNGFSAGSGGTTTINITGYTNICRASGGSGGAGGTASAGGGPTGGTSGQYTGGNGGGTSITAAAGSGSNSNGAGGGGAGGGISTANAPFNAGAAGMGAGTTTNPVGNAVGGTVPGGAGTNSPTLVNLLTPGWGASGGAGSITGAAGSGGAGSRGAGAGGGGASRNGFNSGAGGVGGAGYAYIIFY